MGQSVPFKENTQGDSFLTKWIFSFSDKFEEYNEEDLKNIIDVTKSVRDHSDEPWDPPQPSSDSTVWRYLNFTELMSILERGGVWFSNISQFDDPYEGTIPQKNISREIDEIARRADVEEDLAKRVHSVVTSGSSYGTSGFVSCWNLSNNESAALWEQYIEASEGVAIRTSVDQLERAFSESERELTFGEIEYIDYTLEEIPPGMMPTLYHKRKSFEHECEFRISFLRGENEDLDGGTYIKVDIDTLIDEIYLAPTAPNWFYDQIERVLDTYGVSCGLEKSDIYSDPVY